jgi:hypothetical protein
MESQRSMPVSNVILSKEKGRLQFRLQPAFFLQLWAMDYGPNNLPPLDIEHAGILFQGP